MKTAQLPQNDSRMSRQLAASKVICTKKNATSVTRMASALHKMLAIGQPTPLSTPRLTPFIITSQMMRRAPSPVPSEALRGLDIAPEVSWPHNYMCVFAERAYRLASAYE